MIRPAFHWFGNKPFMVEHVANLIDRKLSQGYEVTFMDPDVGGLGMALNIMDRYKDDKRVSFCLWSTCEHIDAVISELVYDTDFIPALESMFVDEETFQRSLKTMNKPFSGIDQISDKTRSIAFLYCNFIAYNNLMALSRSGNIRTRWWVSKWSGKTMTDVLNSSYNRSRLEDARRILTSVPEDRLAYYVWNPHRRTVTSWLEPAYLNLATPIIGEKRIHVTYLNPPPVDSIWGSEKLKHKTKRQGWSYDLYDSIIKKMYGYVSANQMAFATLQPNCKATTDLFGDKNSYLCPGRVSFTPHGLQIHNRKPPELLILGE